ncbi:MAG: nucleoside hydrolase [Pseudomonadota bacterium]
MKKILIDTDPGIDDAMAIHLAFAHPALKVVGLTTVFGNVHTKTATRNALRLVEMAGVDCPVAHGAEAPQAQPLHPPADFVHGAEGFGDVAAAEPSRTPDPRGAAEFIVDTINAYPGEIMLCPVGPLTNIAAALRLDPKIRTKVAEVVVMGGAVDTAGNVTKFAEANIWNDPHAAAEVFAADWPIMMIGLDVTEKSRCSPEDFAALAESSPDIGGFLNEAVQYYFEFHRKKGVMDGCFMHDPSAVLAVDDPSLFAGRAIPIRVVTEGPEIGRTVADPDADTRPVQICLGVDSAEVRSRFLTITGRADACRDARKG